jgi:Predicted membrane protein
MSRSRFWMSLSVLGGSWVTMDMVLACGDSDTKALRAPLELMVLIACLMLHVKRCHDRDRSGWFVLVALVPPFTLWYLIETLCLRGTQGSNRFGRDPLSSQRARVKWRKGLRQQRLRARRERHIPSSTCRSMSGTQPFPAFNCSGLRTKQTRLANSDTFRPTIIANKKASGLMHIANGPTVNCKRLANSKPD